jgi:cysteine desulfurase
MIYLDYSATTPVDNEVIRTFSKVCEEYWANPNSLHKEGVKANALINASTEQIANILGVKISEIIYTSGASESNNMAIKGICLKYQNRGKHIITTDFEHSSIYGPLGYLQKLGFDVDFVKTLENGKIDIEHLKSLIRDDTILVSMTAVNSEIGIIEPIEEIGLLLKDYPKVFFHVDMTQSIGKRKIDLTNVDLASFSAHKFFGVKGIGVLFKKENIGLEPIIHGGKSTTIYRSGTPATPLIASISKALRLVNLDMDKHYLYVSNLNRKVRDGLSKYDKVRINSPEDAIPYILNISVIGVKPEVLLHSLEEDEVYISTQTACSSKSDESKAVYALTSDHERSKSSVRISLSYKTTEEEIDSFLRIFDKCYNKLTNLR